MELWMGILEAWLCALLAKLPILLTPEKLLLRELLLAPAELTPLLPPPELLLKAWLLDPPEPPEEPPDPPEEPPDPPDEPPLPPEEQPVAAFTVMVSGEHWGVFVKGVDQLPPPGVGVQRSGIVGPQIPLAHVSCWQ